MAEDLSKFGTPVESEDLSKFGTPVDPQVRETPARIATDFTVGGALSLGRTAVAGAGAFGQAVVDKAGEMISRTSGVPFGEIFNQEFQIMNEKIPEYKFVTQKGKKLSEVVTGAIGDALQAYGDTAYILDRIPYSPGDFMEASMLERLGKIEGSPAAGALAEAVATLATLVSPISRKGKVAPKIDPIADFDTKYPKTRMAIDASRVGKVSIGTDPELGGTVKVLDAVNTALDKELGPMATDVPLGDKFRLIVSKYGQDIPMSEQIRYANAQVEKFMTLQTAQDAIIASRPRLSDKRPSFIVDSEGIAATPDQILRGAVDENTAIVTSQPAFKPGEKVLLEPFGISKPIKFTILGKDGEVHYLFNDLDKNGKPTQISIPESRLFRNQRGSIDVEGLEQNIPELKRAAENIAMKSWSGGAADKAKKTVDGIYEEMRKRREISLSGTFRAIRSLTVDPAYNLEHNLMQAGPEGVEAALKWNIQHSAQMRAKDRYAPALQNIFGDLDKDSTRAVEEITFLRRIVQSDKSKGPGTISPPGGLTGADAYARLQQLEGELGDKWKNLNGKATAIFTEEKANIHRLLEKGEIDKAMFENLINLYHSREDYIDAIDPQLLIESKALTKTALRREIRASGIPLGKDAGRTMDAATLLEDSIARVESRIAKGDTLRAMRKLAESNPENGLVAIPKNKDIPDGWTSIGHRLEGKPVNLLVRDDIAAEFVADPAAWLNKGLFKVGDADISTATINRVWSGSALLRATSTTANPAFFFAGLPMDIAHIWMATKSTGAAGEYSAHPFIFLPQIGKDLAKTAKDSWTHGPNWQQAMREGMGTTFMTHELRGSGVAKMFPKAMRPYLEELGRGLTYINENQDVWVRMAHRQRMIDGGIPSETATAMAVQRLRYGRAGVVTKFIDTIYPYTSISVNATSRMLENAKADPKGMAIKLGYFYATAVAVKLANMFASPETDKAMSTDDKVRNLNITFGDNFFIMDPDGRKRYFYVPIRVDQVLMPHTALATAILEEAEYGRIPDKIVSSAIGQVNPISSLLPPTLEGARAYIDNYNSFTDNPTYQGMKVKPEDQTRSFAHGRPTSPLARGAGSALGMSPVGLEQLTSKVINGNNMYLQMMGFGYKKMFDDFDPREQAQSTLEMIANLPGVNRILKLTTPGHEDMVKLEKAEQEVNSKLKKQIDTVDEMLFKIDHSQGVSMKQLGVYINSQSEQDRKHLEQHAKHAYQVDQIMKHYGASDGIPDRSWWIRSSKIKDEARAQVFYDKYLSSEPEQRKRMWAIANKLQAAGVGYVSEGFQREIKREAKLIGDIQR